MNITELHNRVKAVQNAMSEIDTENQFDGVVITDDGFVAISNDASYNAAMKLLDYSRNGESDE